MLGTITKVITGTVFTGIAAVLAWRTAMHTSADLIELGGEARELWESFTSEESKASRAA
jgi:hypothetical protein